MRILITGVAGFVGSHMVEYALREHPEAEVHGADRWLVRRDNIRHLDGAFTYHEFDMTDYGSTLALMREVKPEIIFHLAAQSFVPTSWRAPHETLQTNILGELNVFESVRELGLDPSIQIACSSEEYGLVDPKETPIKETNPLRPLSPYGVSKVAQDMLGYQYHRSYGMRIIRTRAFNHTGPRRGEVFATSAFAKQVAEAEAGRRESVLVGNLEAERDFTDVRDIVRGYWLAAEEGEAGEVYNICSGTARSMREVLNTLIRLSRPIQRAAFWGPPLTIERDPDRMRPSDVPLLCGDHTKFTERTGWEPSVPFDTTMKDLLEYWRERITKP